MCQNCTQSVARSLRPHSGENMAATLDDLLTSILTGGGQALTKRQLPDWNPLDLGKHPYAKLKQYTGPNAMLAKLKPGAQIMVALFEKIHKNTNVNGFFVVFLRTFSKSALCRMMHGRCEHAMFQLTRFLVSCLRSVDISSEGEGER
jgi:hypothetical protein